jgi:uncharacterized membrane protein YcaP (DUF421 family)
VNGAFFGSWDALARVLIVGTLSYAALILVLRITGKRTLSKMNAFDLVVTVALGSALATTILSKTTPLAEGVAALTLLVCLQYAATWLAVRSAWFRGVIKAEPTLLVHRGQLLRPAMRKERVTEDEVLAAVRASSSAELHSRLSVVLETDGSLSVLSESDMSGGRSSLENVRRR